MSGLSTLKLEATIANNKISMCAYEDGTTAPHYDENSVSLSEVFSLCNEIIALLNKANGAAAKSSGMSSELKKAGQCLYDQLLTEAAKKKFRASKAVDLEVYIDEVLVAIPWELLFDGTQFLCLRFNMGRKVKTRQPSRSAGERISTFPIKMLILADPTNDLPMARQEAGIIEKQLDGMRKIIAVAKKVTNIDPVYVKKNLRDYDIVHYAGHADHDPVNLSQSGWKLSGGQLTAEDIAKMGATAPLPALVFSNACRSAQNAEWVGGDFETQVFGLANAFLCAGVRHYIGTSWKIPDDTSLAFAKEFYAQLSQSKSVGKALRLARLQIIKEQGEDSIVWASYVLYGNPTSLLLGRPIKKVFSLPLQWIKERKFVLVLIVVGIIGGIWGVVKILEVSPGDKQAVIDYNYRKGIAFNKEGVGTIDQAESFLRKALKTCISMADCNKADIEDALEDLQSIKAFDKAVKTQDFDMRIQVTMDSARSKSKKFFNFGPGEDGTRTESMRIKAVERFRIIVQLLEERQSLTAEQKALLAEAYFSLKMLSVPSDFDRAQMYYEKFLVYAFDISKADRNNYYARMVKRLKFFVDQGGYLSPCPGIVESRYFDAHGSETSLFDTLVQEGWIERLSENTGRLKVVPDEKFWSRLNAFGPQQSAWATLMCDSSCKRGGSLYFRVFMDNFATLSVGLDLPGILKKIEASKKIDDKEAAQLEEIRSRNNGSSS